MIANLIAIDNPDQDSELLIKTLEENGFGYFIDFEELSFDDVVGTGGYGDVYKACWSGTPVALKKFAQNRFPLKKVIKNFTREIEILNKLRHPNIILFMGPALQIRPTGIEFYMVTEFAPNGSLFDILHEKKQKIPIKEVFFIAR